VPNDRSARQGDAITLSVNMQAVPNMQLLWFFNDNETDQQGTNYLISSLQATNVGRYALRVSIGSVRFFTDPVEIQINSDGETNALARDKLLDSVTSPVIGDDGAGSPLAPVGKFAALAAAAPGVVRGYNGSQVFNTTYATSDPGEPAHCGVAGGASYWLSYQPPASGTITLDTIGSTYDTVLEAYTYNGTLSSYQDLISVACDNDALTPQGPSRVTFAVIKGRPYLVVVAGVNGARGAAWLNYNLNTNLTPQPPVLMSLPQTNFVAAGSSVLLTAPITGSPPLQFSWRKDGTLLSGANSATVSLTNLSRAQSGNYSFTVTNDLGGPISATLVLRVLVPTSCALSNTPDGVQLTFSTLSGQNYIVESASSIQGPWVPWTDLVAGTGQIASMPFTNSGAAFFRLRIE
jgi:hypothetical protein